MATPAPSRRRRLPPPALLAIALLLTIILGALLLKFPAAQAGPNLSWIEALFTATSAACVTGLVVVDTGTQFTFFGQVVILLLIQIGGLGVMTIGTMVLLAFGHRPSVIARRIATGLASHQPTFRIRDILGTVLLTTFTVELCGAGLLFLVFVESYPASQAAWLAVFHSVSAFCNAGFGLWSDSLSRYADNLLINFTIMSLIVIGGLGFVVVIELWGWLISRVRRAGAYMLLSLHSKIMLMATVVTAVGGALLISLLETGNTLAGRPWQEQLLIAGFQSVTARTAGFNTVDTAALSNPTLLVLIGLMFVGAGPGSMAGGIKLTSAAVVFALVIHRIRGNREIRLFKRAIGERTVQRAVVLSVLAALLIGMTVCAIEFVRASGPPSVAGRSELFEVLFEVVSAFGTVGLSMGITAELDLVSKVLLIGLMFVGRLGPLALMDFFEHLPPAPPLRYTQEELMVG